MNAQVCDGNIILQNPVDFSVTQTLECGQCFHFKKLREGEYALVYKNKLLHISESSDGIILYNTSLEDYENIWKYYFDLDNDYGAIKEYLLRKDDKLAAAINEMYGVRILNQDFFETLISFIISQNKQIPHIKQLVATLSERYGDYLGEVKGEKFYSFPIIEKMLSISLEDLYECKTGFRAPYIFDAVHKVYDKTVEESVLRSQNYEDCLNNLLQIKGVGEKVANCVMLFSLGKRSAFPIDVWIKRIVEEMYFHQETKKEVIAKFAREHFGEYGGYAQQYLFYYGRENKTGKNVKKEEKERK